MPSTSVFERKVVKDGEIVDVEDNDQMFNSTYNELD